MKATLLRDVVYGGTTIPAGTVVGVIEQPSVFGRDRTAIIDHDGARVTVSDDAIVVDYMPESVRELAPWLWRQGAQIAAYEERNYRLSGRETRFTDDEVRDDYAVFTVIGRDNIDRFKALMQEANGEPLREEPKG